MGNDRNYLCEIDPIIQWRYFEFRRLRSYPWHSPGRDREALVEVSNGGNTVCNAIQARLQPGGPRYAAGRRERAGRGRVVPHRYSAQADEGADAALRRPGDPRHHHLARRARPERRRRRLVLGHLVVRAVLLRLRRALRLDRPIPLARMRPRHRLQDAVDERRGLSDRLLHDHAQPGDLALEPYAPPHRHDHRRPRPRDRRHAARRTSSASSSTSSASSMPGMP